MSEPATPLAVSSPTFDVFDHDGRRDAPGPVARKRFRAMAGSFNDAHHRCIIDGLARWVEHAYSDDLAQRPSKHVYVRKLPPWVVAQIDELRGSATILDDIRRQFAPSQAITPMTHTDELYISHYNKDQGGDQGLFDKHYDGNLGFLRFVTVVRALIYLQSDATYTVVFGDSKLARAFGTYEFGLLDFHRELHWVEGDFVPGGPQRILLKCNYLVAPRDAGWLVRPVAAANTGVFYLVKAAMEYSKSPKTAPQVVVGWVCNAARRLNNVHPVLPLAALGVAIAAVGWGLVTVL